MNTAQPIAPEQAAALIRQGAILVDIRAPDEYRRLHIPGAHLAPLDSLPQALPAAGDRTLIFHCRSGLRTQSNAQRLAASTPNQTRILAGGLDAWRAAGLPIVENKAQPLEIMRQVQIVAGVLILAGLLLGAVVAPAFYALSACVGAGLLVAGITGFCGMARLLAWLQSGRAERSVILPPASS